MRVSELMSRDVVRHIAGAETPGTPELDIVISYP